MPRPGAHGIGWASPDDSRRVLRVTPNGQPGGPSQRPTGACSSQHRMGEPRWRAIYMQVKCKNVLIRFSDSLWNMKSTKAFPEPWSYYSCRQKHSWKVYCSENQACDKRKVPYHSLILHILIFLVEELDQTDGSLLLMGFVDKPLLAGYNKQVAHHFSLVWKVSRLLQMIHTNVIHFVH